MTKRIGLIRKNFLTRERIFLIVEDLTSPSRQRKWTPFIRKQWHEFLDNIEDNVTRIYYQLRYRVWNPNPFIVFPRKENGKTRIVYASMPEELIVDTLYTDCLNYVFLDKKHIVPRNCYGSIRGKGQHELRKAIIQKVHGRTDLYVGCWDSKQYYPTIDHHIAMQTFRKHIKDVWLLWLCETCLKRMGDVGVALGLPSSNPFGHIYHAALDWLLLLDYKVRRFYRFCDDKWAIHRDVNYLHTISRVIVDHTKEMLHQVIKPNWRIVWCKEERFECLGAMINSHGARLRSSSRRRIERRMRKCIKIGDPMLAYRSWSGIRGGLRDLSISNLLEYWKDVYSRFFDLLAIAGRNIATSRRRKKWHNRLEYILTNADDMRCAKNKEMYPYGSDYTEEKKVA